MLSAKEKIQQQKLDIQKALPILNGKVSSHFSPITKFEPKLLIICGSGLGNLTTKLASKPHLIVPYTNLPGFQSSTVQGHSGELWFGHLKDTPVIIMKGRLHSYEGYDIKDTVYPIRLLHQYSQKYCNSSLKGLIVTNAAGGLNDSFKIGDFMMIYDHLNIPGFSGNHPLVGPNWDEDGERFLAISDAYDFKLRKLFFNKFKSLQQQGLVSTERSVHEGTYSFVSGPTFESRSEARFLKAAGSDVVGMSTVPEVIVARHCGWKVLALSVITNNVVTDLPQKATETIADEEEVPLDKGKANHKEVLETGLLAAKDLELIVESLADGF
ncbi:hypothetical protein QEN19_003260 [Hanseniaspora menglaensis]